MLLATVVYVPLFPAKYGLLGKKRLTEKVSLEEEGSSVEMATRNDVV